MADSPLGVRIKRARQLKRVSGRTMTQRDLADALGVDRKTVDNWENDRTRPRDIYALEAILGVNLTDSEDVQLRFQDTAEKEFWQHLMDAGLEQEAAREMLEDFRQRRAASGRAAG